MIYGFFEIFGRIFDYLKDFRDFSGFFRRLFDIFRDSLRFFEILFEL